MNQITYPTDHSKQFVLIIHDVEDFEKWKVIFDNAAEIRRQAGEIEYKLLSTDTDSRRVVHFSKWISLDAARKFFESPKLVEIRRIAGVHAPEFHYLNEIEEKVL